MIRVLLSSQKLSTLEFMTEAPKLEPKSGQCFIPVEDLKGATAMAKEGPRRRKIIAR